MSHDPDPIAHGIRLLRECRQLLVLSGAGMSAESGIPTFREAQTGLWARFSPEELATPEAFAAHPERVWQWYRWRRSTIARGGVNPGHRAIAALETSHAITIATQNVDGLHGAAGSTDVAELHGSIWRDRCDACGFTVDQPVVEADESSAVPCCTECGALMRPAVVWFGEMLPVAALEAAETALRRCDLVLVVGTSNRVYPAAGLVDAAVASSTPVIEINPETTPVSRAVDLRIAATASTALPALVDGLNGHRDGRPRR